MGAVKKLLSVSRGQFPLKKGGSAEGVGVVMQGSKEKTKMLMALGIVLPLMFTFPVL